MSAGQPNNPLHGLTLEHILRRMVGRYGWDGLARTRLRAAPLAATGLGFVILHRCGESFYFLIVCTWRNSNELWQTVFYKDGEAMKEFALYPRDGEHKPTLCVWELVPVGHEQ